MDPRWIEIEALVLRAQKGDREAFGDLCVRFERSVTALARQRVRDPHEADELVQEVFLHAMRKIGQLRSPAAFGAWLRRITVRVAINRGLRKQPVAVAETSVLESAVRPGPEPLDDLVREERRRKVRDAVAKLKPIDRDALAAFYLRGRSLLEIAREFDVPVGTVKRRLHTARRRLQGSLDGAGFGGDFASAGLGATGSASASVDRGYAGKFNGQDADRQVGNKEVAAKASVKDNVRIGPRKRHTVPTDSRPSEPAAFAARRLKPKRELALAD